MKQTNNENERSRPYELFILFHLGLKPRDVYGKYPQYSKATIYRYSAKFQRQIKPKLIELLK